MDSGGKPRGARERSPDERGGDDRCTGERGAERAMDQHLKTLGLHRKRIAKDGSCLFRAVAEQVLHCQSLHTKVRADCVNFLKQNRENYEAFIEGDFEEYLFKLQDPQQWVGEVEINALAVMYKRDFLIFQEPGKNAVNITDNNFKDKVQLCFLNGNHYDSVYPISHIKNAAVCQSILYELLYDGVFNVERGALTVTQRFSRPNDFLSDDVMNPCDSSDESDAGTGDGNWVETETNTTAPRFNNQSYRGRGRGRSLPERVRRSLNPTLLRNIEYDVWQKTKRAQQKMDYCIAAGMQFTAGDRCQVRIEGTGRSYNATIKEVPPNGLVTVYIEELGKRQVNLWCLRPPPPPNDDTSWSTVVNRDKRLSNGHGDWEERGRGRGRRKDLSGPISAVSTVTGSGGRVQKQHSWPPQATVEEQKPTRKSSSSIEAVLEMTEEEQILRSVALAEMLNDENSFPALGSQSGMQGDGGKKKRSLGSKTKSPVEDLVRAVSPSGGDRPKSSTPPLTPISTPAAAPISTPPTSNAPTTTSPNATNTSEPTPKYPDSNHSFLGSIKATIPHTNPTHANSTSISSPTLPAAAPMAKSNTPWQALPTESRQYSQVVSPSHINASLPLQTHTNSNPTIVATATVSSPTISSAAQVAKSSTPSHTLTTEESHSPHVVALGGKPSVAPQSVPSSATLISQLPPVLPAPTFIAPIAPSLPRHSPSPPLFPSSSSSLSQQTAQTNEAPQATPTNALPTIGGSQTVLQSFHTQHQSQAPSPMSHTPSPVPLTLATATLSDTLPHHPSMPSLPQNLSQIVPMSQPTITQIDHHQTVPYSTQNQAPVPHTQSQTLATLTQGGPQSMPSLPQNLTQITQYDPHHQNHHSQPQNQASFPHMHQTAEAPTTGSLQLHQSNLSHMQNHQQQQNQNQHSELATSPQAINPASLAQYHHQYMPQTQATYPQATQGSTHYPNPQMIQPPHPSQVPHPSASLSISPNQQQQLSQSPHIQTETHTIESNMNMPPSTHAYSLSMQTHTQTPQIQAQTHTQTPQMQAQNQAHSLTMEMHQTQNQNQAHSLSMQTGQSQAQAQSQQAQSQQAQMQPQSIPGVVPLQQLSQLYTDPLYPGFPTQEKGDMTPAMTPPMSANATGCDLPQDISILRFFFNLGVKAYSMPMCPPYIYLFPLQQAYSMHPRLPSRSPSPPPQYNPPNPPNPVPTRTPESYQHPSHPYAQTSTSMASPYEHQIQMTTTAMAVQSINPYELQNPQVTAADPLHSNHPGYPPAITQPPPHQRMQPWQQHQQPQQHNIAPQQPPNNRNPSSNFQSVMGYNVVPSPSPPYGVSQAINQGAAGGGYHQSHSPQGHSMYPQYPQNSHSSLGYQTAATPEDIHGGAAMEQAVNNRAMMGSNPDIKTLHHHPHAVSMGTMKPPSNSSSPGSPSIAKTTTTTITTGNFPSDPNNIPQPQPHHGYQQRNHQYQQQYYQATPSYGLIDPSHGALSVGCSTEDDLEEMAGIRPITSANRGPRRGYRGGPVSARTRQAHEQGRGQQRRRGGQSEGQQGQPGAQGAGNYIQFNSSYRGRGR